MDEPTETPVRTRSAGALALGATSAIADVHRIRTGRVLFALAMIGLGLRGLRYGDLAGVWQHLPIAVPGEALIAGACALIELAGGVGLLMPRTARPAAATLAAFLLLWCALLKLPGVVAMPAMEATWLGLGEIVVLLAGAWLIHAAFASPLGAERGVLTGVRGVRNARLAFALALPTIGLSHFIYADVTAGFVPAWLPWRHGWAYLTGAANLATCLALLLGVWPRLAAALEAGMLAVITLLVWVPALVTQPSSGTWAAFLISSAIAAGAWVVADSYRGVAWFATATPRIRRDAPVSL
ncbi:MAG TPA: hypothetical protein VGC30_07455 [Dokdonella sp.]